MKRRVFALSGLLLAAALGAGGAAQAQDQPLRILVGFPAGGGTDAIARHLAHDMSLALKRNVVVENRPGAGGQIAANALKAAAPDGHTLFFSNSHALAMIPLTRSVFWGPMAVAIMGGLIVATVLTVFFLPALYAAWYRVKV